MLCIFINNAASRKDSTIQYLTGYNPEFCLLAHDIKTGKQCIFVASFECGMYKGITQFSFNKDTFVKHLKSFFNKRAIKVVGVNKEALSVKSFATLKKYISANYKDVSTLFSRKRLIKKTFEVHRITSACRITDQLFTEVTKQKFLTEHAIAAYLLKRMIDEGVEPSFYPVVATGIHARKPHHHPGKTKLSGFTVLDFGVRYKGYCSDMTRMLYYGTPSAAEKATYQLLRESYNVAIAHLIPGKRFAVVDAKVRALLGDAFTHALGHGIGVEVHEAPAIAPKSRYIVKDGMVFTIEPGMYKTYGMRLEDTVTCSNGKIRRLTKSPHELVILPKP